MPGSRNGTPAALITAAATKWRRPNGGTKNQRKKYSGKSEDESIEKV